MSPHSPFYVDAVERTVMHHWAFFCMQCASFASTRQHVRASALESSSMLERPHSEFLIFGAADTDKSYMRLQQDNHDR